MAINNYITFPDRRPPAFNDKGQIDEILSKYSNFPYVHTANICGARIKLLTNSKHVSEFWQLNWYASDSKDADGFVYIITGVEGYEPCLFYNLEKRIALGVNTEYYGLAKSKSALGLATEILKEMEKYPMHAASVSLKRNNEEFGVAIIAPTGTGKTTQSMSSFITLETVKLLVTIIFLYLLVKKKL
jgi:hypothetical protein